MSGNILLHNVNLNLDPRKSFTQNDGQYIGTDEIRARDGDGLKLYDDGGAGIFVEDGGNVGIGTTEPSQKLEVNGSVRITDALTVVIQGNFPSIYVTSLRGYGHVNLNIQSQTGRDIVFQNDVTEVMRIKSGNVGIGTTEPTTLLDVNNDKVRLRTAKTPATAGAAGNAGDICWDADYVYVCVDLNTWKRAALTTW